MKRLFLTLLLFSAVESGQKTEPPPIFRGILIAELPLTVIPVDSTSGGPIWIPVPEMGFAFHPTIRFKDGMGWWEFPANIMTFAPFLDKYGAIGDISIGAGFEAPPVYRFGIRYRYLTGVVRPVNGRFNANAFVVDVALPIQGFTSSGVRFEWVADFKLDMDRNCLAGEVVKYHYFSGTFLTLVPYWRFRPGYGEITLAIRIVLSHKITGTDTQTHSSYRVKNTSITMGEITYTFP